MMENRKRNVHLHVMVTPDELAAIHERMAEAGISNAGASKVLLDVSCCCT